MSKSDAILTVRAAAQVALFIVAVPLLPMIVSGDWSWWQAWSYLLSGLAAFAVSRGLAARRHPDLLAERARFLTQKDTKRWDRVLAPLLALCSILILAVAGLDRFSRRTPTLSLGVELAALGGLLLGYAFSSWALIENGFFSGTVRIQTDRGQRVISSGPYRLVRHPGYAGGLLGYVATPLLLDSLWAFIPTLLLLVILVVRTALEDRTLQAELAGYAEYARRTRYRLLPGVW